jgi:DNA polymerase-3 subunit delta'
MAQEPQSTATLNYSVTTPAYLFVGSHETALEETIRILQSRLCAHKGCTVCAPCRQIQLQQHHSISWFYPEKNYTLEQFESIGQQLSFTLDKDHHYFFIIQKAEALTPACANALLKSLEEPPTGYQFILITQRPDALLPTIRSRCVQYTIQAPDCPFDHPLTPFFTTEENDANQFMQTLEKNLPTEQESVELVDALLSYWCTRYKHATTVQEIQKQRQAEKYIHLFSRATQQLPMAGSSKLFWKNLFLQR